MSDDPVLVLPPAELDPSTCDDLATTLAELDPGLDVIVDFAGVDFCDSSGLRVLIVASKRHQAAGGSLRVANPRPRVARVFELTGLVGLLSGAAGQDRRSGQVSA